MLVEIDHPDESTTAFFGVSDFVSTEDNGIVLWFHEQPPAADKRKRNEDGKVDRAVSEMSYNKQGALETIAGLALEEDTKVVIVPSENYPWVERAAIELTEEDGFDGDLDIQR
jgi:hypothetical protein